MAPERLGKYEIRGTLGKGAMGTVYAAWDPVISRQVAIKTVRLPDAGDIEAQEELARFKREAQAAGRLTHPNIVGIFDYGESDELAYIVMEYVAGRTLKSVLDGEARMPVGTVDRIMAGLLAGLQYSHERGVVHRDIKPANVMLDEGGQAKIADFGIARIESSNLTQAGTIMGTPAYMSPEQFMGQTVDARTDIYSSGVLLFQLLTGERPFEGSMATIMHKALNVQPPKPSDLSVTAPVALDAVVARAMGRRPEQRFATAGDFAVAIRAALDAPPMPRGLSPGLDDPADDATVIRTGPATTRPLEPTQVAKPMPQARRSKAPVLAAVAFVALAGAGLGGAWLYGAFDRAPAPFVPTLPPVAIAVPGGGDVLAAIPPTAPPPPTPAAPVAAPPSPPEASPPPLPRPELTQVVPPSTEHAAASPRSSDEVTRGTASPAQIIPPAPTPGTGPSRLRIAGRNDLGSVPLEPAVTVAPTIQAPNNAAPDTAASAPAATAGRIEPQMAVAPPPETSSPGRVQAPSPRPPAPEPAVAAVPQTAPEPAQAASPPPSPPPRTETPAQQTETAPPATVAEAGLSPDALRRSIAAAALGTDCAVLHGDVARSGTLSIQGVIGGGKTQDVLRQLREISPTAPVDWSVREANGPYCGALNLVRAFARPFGAGSGGIEVGLKDGRTDLVADEKIEIRATMAAFPAYLQVDYFASDGSVAHLRTASQGSPTVAARSNPSFVAGDAAPPFGTDLIVAVAAAAPLFPKGKTLPDTADAYLRELRTALEAAKQHRTEVATGVVVVHTSAKR